VTHYYSSEVSPVGRLRHWLVRIVFVLFFFLPSSSFAELDLTEYELVFFDEFESSVLDESKWETSFFWGPYTIINQEEQLYVDTHGLNSSFDYSPFVLSDGVLSITAVPTTPDLPAPLQPPENDPLWDSSPDLNFNSDYDASSRNYLSGIITSAESYNVTHGYFEARLRFPAGQGLWPAFWLLNSKYVENTPEIDIVEFLGHKPNTVHHTAHYVDTSVGYNFVSTPTYETTGPNYTEEFHTYGLAWDPKSIRFFVDGEVVREIQDSEFLIATQSMYILLNLAVGGVWPGSPDTSTQFPASFDIDYVRAYERKSIDTITEDVLEDEYVLMFSDEFNGSTLNEEVWNTAYLWGPYLRINNEEQVYIDRHGIHNDHPVNPFEVSGGTLKIKADLIDENDLPGRPPDNDLIWSQYPSYQRSTTYLEPNGWTPEYSSGVLTSYDSFKFVNGYAEARIKMPVGDGLWPAFWLLNGYYVGPSPEMDIMEARGGEQNRSHHSYHYSNNVGELISSAEIYDLVDGGIDNFHTYGFQWDTERMVWYVDGIPVREFVGAEVSEQLSYVLINLAVGGNFVNDVASISTPAEMEIDWVRVWQIDREETIEQPAGNESTYAIANDQWVQIGPLYLGQPTTLTSMFAGRLSANSYGTTWQALEYVQGASASGYRVVGVTEPLKPGRGYWLKQISGVDIQISLLGRPPGDVNRESADCPSGTVCITDDFPTAEDASTFWTKVSNPYSVPVPIDDLFFGVNDGGIKEIVASDTQASRFAHSAGVFVLNANTGAYEFRGPGSVLEPMQGGWIGVVSNLSFESNPRFYWGFSSL